MSTTENEILPKGFKRIPYAAENFLLSPNGIVYNRKTGKFLKRYWTGYGTYTNIKKPNGKQYHFKHENIDVPERRPLTREWVLEEDGAKIIPEFPDYAVSHYGAIYNINPSNRGPKGGKVFMLQEFSRRGHGCVNLLTESRKYKIVRVSDITEQLWGSDATYTGEFNP